MILIVDDEFSSRRLIRLTLEDFGIDSDNIVECTSGKEALNICEELEYPPDLIITDIIMPEVNGYELCKQLRSKNSPCNEIPILFVSGNSEPLKNALETLSIGGDGYIEKPIEAETLLSRVKICLNLSRVRGDIRKFSRVIGE